MTCTHYKSLVMRKRVFGVSDQIRHKPVCSATETSESLELLDIETTMNSQEFFSGALSGIAEG